jgi:hypothetical protein
MTSRAAGAVWGAAERVQWFVEGEARSNSWWSLQARFVLTNGRLFVPVQRPPDPMLGEPKRCYVNAAYAALDGEYRYCEGWAITGQHVVAHAWVTRHGEEAIDVTWSDPGEAYLGVALSPAQLQKALAATSEAFGPVLDWLVVHTGSENDEP